MRTKIARALRKNAPWLTGVLIRRFPRVSRRKVLAPYPGLARGTWSSRRLNFLAEAAGSSTSYLEIGIQSGNTLEAVELPYRVGVDPEPLMNQWRLPRGVTVLPATSDEFFAAYEGPKFDLIFLDGLHEWFQTYRDILNALKCLSDKGVVLVDDVIPSDAISAMSSMKDSYQRREQVGSSDRRWHGDVYKSILAIHDFHRELEYRVIYDVQGNSQALVWVGKTVVGPQLEIRARSDQYEHVSYADIFQNGEPPGLFNAGTEDVVLAEVSERWRPIRE